MPNSEEFLKRLRATFRIEAEEHLQAMTAQFLALEKLPAPAERAAAIEIAYREAHSLKGAARAVDFADIETICQELESVFAAWKHQGNLVSPAGFDTLHKTVDLIRTLLDLPSGARLQERAALQSQLARLRSGTGEPPPAQALPAAEAAPASAPRKVQAPAEPDRSAASDTVRISIAKLDSQLLQAEDMLPLKSLMAQRAAELRELVDMLDQWRARWIRASADARTANLAAGPSPLRTPPANAAGLSDFLEWNADFHRSLEQRLRALSGDAQQDHYALSRRLDDLLEDSKKLLMLPFSTLAGIFPKMVRDLCREQSKNADLIIDGGDVEIDKRILEEMKDPLIHMLRNAVGHGIESPEDRARTGKPARGTIRIAVSQVNGSKVEILVSDDGRGVDLHGIQRSAVQRGIIPAADAQSLTNAESLALVFNSEVSTSPIVTNLSGRGLGMPIARSKAEKLGGQITIQSDPHVGTTVRVVLPLTLATTRGILVLAAGRTFVMPASNVEYVLRIRPEDIQTMENRETIRVQGRVVALARLASVLDLPPAPQAAEPGKPLPVMILRAAGERIAFLVDEVMHQEEVLVKAFRKPLLRVRNLAGATVLGSGKAAPILHVADLMHSARVRSGSPTFTDALPPVESAARRILVVEDSITSRMLLKGILESAGYQVKVAVDGMEGFTMLREEPFDLVVSDVEMPRLNGFDLALKIRSDKRLAEMPIVLVTALESPAQRERGIDVGANAYIVKSSFDQSNLIDVVRRLI
jgi:two-component system chemotaxis sensor kinase CheA